MYVKRAVGLYPGFGCFFEWVYSQAHTRKFGTSWSASSSLVDEYYMHQGTEIPKTRRRYSLWTAG